jgi:hypothetical protein
MSSIHVTCQPGIHGEHPTRLTVAWDFLIPAVGSELLRIESDGFKDDASARSARHCALGSYLPRVECGGELVPVIHDLPDVIVVIAQVPSREISHIPPRNWTSEEIAILERASRPVILNPDAVA